MAKTSLKTIAYNTIRQKIVICEYMPGTFLNENLLAEELHLSRTPVRDAISRLEQERLVEIKPKHGIIVTPLSISDINMLFEVRLLYEPYVLRTYGSLLPEKQLMELYNIFFHKNENSECFKGNDYFYDLDSQFHQMVIDSCPNLYIRQNYELIRTQDMRFRYMTGNVSNNRLNDTFREHLDIIVPCLKKDWETAAEKMIYHIEESKKAAFNLIFESMGGNRIGL